MAFREVSNLIRSGKFNAAIPQIKSLGDPIDRNTLNAFVYFLTGNEKSAYMLIEDNIRKIVSENINPLSTIRCLTFYSYFLTMNGKNEDALAIVSYARTLLPKVEEYAGEWEYNQLAGDLLNIEGITYNQLGKSETSIDRYKKSLEFRTKNQSEFDVAIVKSNIALIYLDQGNFKLALQNIRQAIWIFKDLNLEQPLATAYSTIGHLLTQTQDFDSAKFYLEQAIEMFTKLNNPLNLAEAYYRLVTLYVNKNMEKEAKLVLKEIKLATKRVKIKLVDVYYRLSEAILLKSQKRLISKARALEILTSLKSVKSEDSSIYIEVLFHIADLLLFELAMTFDENLIPELNEVLKDISTLANELKSNIIIVKSLIIQAKLFILMSNKSEAEIILKATYKIAEDMDIKELMEEINRIRDDQSLLLEKWRVLGETYRNFEVVKDNDIKSAITINLSKIQDLIRKNQSLQLEQDDFANINRLKRILSDETLFNCVVYKISEYGTDIVFKEFKEEDISDGIQVETYLQQLGIVFSVIIGQGDQYHSGLFNLPAGKLHDYRVLLYVFRIKDDSATDDRMNLAYVFYCVFIPEIIVDYLPPSSELEREFESSIHKASDLSELNFHELKSKIIQKIRMWIDKII